MSNLRITHTHPIEFKTPQALAAIAKDPNWFQSPFSLDDVKVALNGKYMEMRAASVDGSTSILKNSKGKPMKLSEEAIEDIEIHYENLIDNVGRYDPSDPFPPKHAKELRKLVDQRIEALKDAGVNTSDFKQENFGYFVGHEIWQIVIKDANVEYGLDLVYEIIK